MSKQIIAAVAVVAVLGAAYFFLTSPAPQREAGDVWRIPELEDFNRFDVRHDETVVIEKMGDGWRIQEPLDFAAANRQVERVEDFFTDEESRLLVDDEKEATPNNLTRYGFDDDVFHVSIYDGGEAVASFAVGSTEADEAGRTRTWVRPDDGDTLYRLNRDLRSVLDHPLSTWRNTEILGLAREERDAVSAVDVVYPTGSMRFEKVDEEWSAVEPADVELDPDLIDRWVRRINRLNAADFADDVSADEAGLVNPEHTVTIHVGEGDDVSTHELAFGAVFAAPADDGGEEGDEPPPTRHQQRYVRLGDGPIFVVDETDAERYMKRTGDFRPRDVLTLERDSIARIDLIDDGGTIGLVRGELPEASDSEEGEEAEAIWQLVVDGGGLEEANIEAVRRVLTAVSEVEASRFDDDITDQLAGLDTPRRRVQVTLDDGTTHEIAIGAPAEAATGEEGEMDHFARVDAGLIFVLRDFKVRNLLSSADELRPEPEAQEDEGEGEDG